MSSCEDASAGGVGLTLTRPVVLGPGPAPLAAPPPALPAVRPHRPVVPRLHAGAQRAARAGRRRADRHRSSSASSRRAARESLPGELFLMPGRPDPGRAPEVPAPHGASQPAARGGARPGRRRGRGEDVRRGREPVGGAGPARACRSGKGRPAGRGDRRRLQDPRRGAQRLDRRGRQPRLHLLFLDARRRSGCSRRWARARRPRAERMQASRRRSAAAAGPAEAPGRVQGRDADGAGWEEMSTCEDASMGGVALLVAHPVRPGQVLHLSCRCPRASASTTSPAARRRRRRN